MTSISMIVEKPSAAAGGGLGREIRVERGRDARAALAHRVGGTSLATWIALSIAAGWAWGEDALGTVLVLGFLLLPIAMYGLHWSSTRRPIEVALHELGVALRDPRTKAVSALAWNEIAEVFERTEERTDLLGKELRSSFTFVAHDGRTLVIDAPTPNVRDVARAASAMAQEVMSVNYELGLVAQRPLRFGDLVVDGYGVHTNQGSFPWRDVTFVRFERRGHEASWSVHVGAWAVAARIPSERIANARALVTILDRLGKLDVPGSAVLAELSSIAA